MTTPTDPIQPPQPQPSPQAQAPPYAAPGSYAQPPAHAPAYAVPSGAAGTVSKTGNPAGLTSLILGAVTLVWQLVFVFIQAFAYSSLDPSAAAGWSAALNLIVLALLGIAGLVFGLIGLSRRDRPRVAAGVGTGLAVAAVFAVILAALFPVIFALFVG